MAREILRLLGVLGERKGCQAVGCRNWLESHLEWLNRIILILKKQS